MFYTEIEGSIRNHGHAYINVNNIPVKLDLTNPHERRYAACSVLNLKYPQYDIDRMLIQKFVRKGDNVLDAGANIGLTALLFLENGAASVTAIEPLPDLYRRIKDLNCESIKPLKAALSDKEGLVEIYVSEAHNQGSTYDIESVNMFRHIFNENIQTICAPKITIDGIKTNFDIWKMDIEGAEKDAVIGANRTLKNNPPRVIFSELWGDKFNEFYDLIKKTHPYAYRASIKKSDYSLCILKPELFGDREHDLHSISPTFIFTRESLF